MDFIKRPAYLDFLIRNRDKENITVLTGLRRSGKTTIFRSYMKWLAESGVPRNRILYFDLGQRSLRSSQSPEELISDVIRRLSPREKNYVFLDEAQDSPHFENAADFLFLRKDIDLCLSVSGSSSVTAPLRRLLPGRCLEMTVFPLSFSEYNDASSEQSSASEKVTAYLRGSTMPGAAFFYDSRKETEGIFSTVLLKDVLLQNRRFSPSLMMKILTFLSVHGGETLSFPTLSRELGRPGHPLTEHTLHRCIDGLCQSGLLQKIEVKMPGQSDINTGSFQYYMTDPGMLGCLLEQRRLLPSLLVRHTAAVEFLRRGYSVYGTPDQSIDFITEDPGFRTLWQILFSPSDPDAVKKADALLKAPAMYRKYILTPLPVSFPTSPEITVTDLYSWLTAPPSFSPLFPEAGKS